MRPDMKDFSDGLTATHPPHKFNSREESARGVSFFSITYFVGASIK